MVITIIIVIVCIFIAIQATLWTVTLSSINGMWYAPVEFCDESGTQQIHVYINEVGLMSSGMAYIAFMSEKGLIINECIPIRVMPCSFITTCNAKKEFTIHFDEFEDDIEDIFPRKQCMIYYPGANKMLWYIVDDDEKRLIAVLYKQSELSETIEKVDES